MKEKKGGRRGREHDGRCEVREVKEGKQKGGRREKKWWQEGDT